MERYGEDLLVRRADVCSRLQRAVVDFCQHTYAGITVNDLEVDGIICISFSNSSEQHVVKIHEKLINARSSSSTDPTRERPITNSNENVLGNHPSPKCSSEITWRGTNEGPVVSAQIVNDTHSGGVQGMLSQASLHCDNIEHDETYIFPNINHERETQDGCIGSRKKVQKLRHEKQKKKFVESVEGDCVIVKVEPEEADSEISDGIYRESTKRADSIVPKSGSHDRHNSADKQSLVDSSEAAMYMVHSGFEFGNGSSSDDKTRDVNDFRYENSSVQFVNSQQVSTTPTWDFYPSSLNTDTHALTLSSVPHGSNEASTCDTNEINRRNTSLAKHFPKNEKWDASAFQNFNLPLASMDSVIPVHSSVELSSANVDAGSKTDVQLVSSLSPQYYKTDSGGNYNVRSQSKNLDDDEPKSRSPFCAKSLSDRGRNSALSHNRRISAIAAARSAARSVIKSQNLPVTSQADRKLGDTFAQLPSDSLFPSQSRYKYSALDTSSRSADRRFFCRYCSKGFTMHCTRSRHEKTICSPAGGGSYRCELCSKVFTRSDSRHRHMFKAHGIQATSCVV